MLTEPQRQQLDGIVQKMQSEGQSDETIQFVVNDFKSKYDTPDNTDETQQNSTPQDNSLAGKLASGVNSAYQKFSNALNYTGVPQTVGVGVGAAGGLIGGAVGAIGTPIANVIEGKPLFDNLGNNIAQSAKDTASFGYDTGKAGVPAAVVSEFGGGSVNTALAAAQGYQGYKDIKQGLQDNNPEQLTAGGLELGTGLLGGASALKAVPGVVDDIKAGDFKSAAKNSLVNVDNAQNAYTGTKNLIKNLGMSTPDEAINAYSKVMNLKPTAYRNLEPGDAKDIAKLLVHDAIPLDVQASDANKFDMRTNVIPKLTANENMVESTLQDVLNQWKGSKTIDYKDILSRTNQIIDDTPNVAAENVLQRKAYAKQLLAAEMQRSGSQLIDPPEANTVKRSMNFAFEQNAAQKTPAAQALRQALREAVETNTNSPIVSSLNERLGMYEKAKDLLDGMEGSPIKGGRLGKLVGSVSGKATSAVVGSILGSAAGHPVTGALVGETLGRISSAVENKINNPNRITRNTIKSFQKQGIMPDTVQTIQQAKDFLANLKEQRAATLRLDAPSEIGTEGNPRQMPQFTDSQIQAQKESSGSIKNSPKPQPGVQVMRPGQKALPTPDGSSMPIPMLDMRKKTVLGKGVTKK